MVSVDVKHHVYLLTYSVYRLSQWFVWCWILVESRGAVVSPVVSPGSGINRVQPESYEFYARPVPQTPGSGINRVQPESYELYARPVPQTLPPSSRYKLHTSPSSFPLQHGSGVSVYHNKARHLSYNGLHCASCLSHLQ